MDTTPYCGSVLHCTYNASAPVDHVKCVLPRNHSGKHLGYMSRNIDYPLNWEYPRGSTAGLVQENIPYLVDTLRRIATQLEVFHG